MRVVLAHCRPVMIQGTFVDCIANLLADIKFAEIRVDYIKCESSVIHYARNNVVKEALKSGNEPPDYFMWVDTDTEWTPQDFYRLLEHGGDGKLIVGANYPKRYPPHTATAGRLNREKHIYEFLSLKDIRNGGIVQVDSLGGGFILVHRSVYETVPYPWYEFGYITGPDYKHPWDLIDIGEDVNFCHRAMKAGFEMWADLDLDIGHYFLKKLTKQDMLEAYKEDARK